MLINREKYVKRAMLFRDSDLVKVVTGIRRCGKSSLLELVRRRIESENVDGRGFISINLEKIGLGISSSMDMYNYIKNNLSDSGRTYVFIDEVQRIEGWHDVINSIRVEFDVDLYVTGSNAFLLSSDISTYLSGRYVEIKMLPLSFSEWCSFCGISFKNGSSGAMTKSGDIVMFDDAFKRFLDYGAMPAIASLDTSQEMQEQYMSSLYEAVIQRDILSNDRNASERKISSPDTLRMVCEYIADTAGSTTSTTKIANTLTSSGRKTSHSTVTSYIKALEDAYVVYPCKRYDLHGREMLKTMPKYYLVDTGMAEFFDGYKKSNTGFRFENAVYLQLLHDGWKVHVGKIYQNEIDFIAMKDGKTVYVQATDEMFSDETMRRELAPLEAIQDNHRKVIVVRQGSYAPDVRGIEIVNARNFFLD